MCTDAMCGDNSATLRINHPVCAGCKGLDYQIIADLGARTPVIRFITGAPRRKAQEAHQRALSQTSPFTPNRIANLERNGKRETAVGNIPETQRYFLRDPRVRKQASIAAQTYRELAPTTDPKELEKFDAKFFSEAYRFYEWRAMQAAHLPDERLLTFDAFFGLIRMIQQEMLEIHTCRKCGTDHIYAPLVVFPDWCWGTHS